MEELKAKSRYKDIGLFFAILIGIYLIYQIPQIVLLFLLTLLFAIVLSGPVNYLARQGLPRGLGIFMVFGALALLLWLLGRWITPAIGDQARQFIADFPSLLVQIQGFITSVQSTFGLENTINLDQASLLEGGRSLISGHTTSRRWSI